LKDNRIFIALALVTTLIVPYLITSDYHMNLINQAIIFTILTLGLNVVLGTAGQLSLATAAFWGIGAYTSALLTVRCGVSFWIAFPLSGVVAALFGMFLGVPSLKVKGHYLAMVTIGFGEITHLVLKNAAGFTGGPNGISNIPVVTFAGVPLSTPFSYYYLLLASLLAAVLFTYRMRASKMGRAFIAISDKEIIAESMGINAHLYKVMAFSISAFWAGIAGSLYAHSFHYINPSTFVFGESVKVMCMLFIGGAGTIFGPIVGSFMLVMLPEWLRFMQEIYMAIYGLGVALMMIFWPKGILGLVLKIKNFSFGSKKELQASN
jgi:branched-chain amino acid transport system permease protein